MRQVYIDLTTDMARLPTGNFIGYLGEHNATELLISIPQNMVDVSDYQILIMQSGPMVFKSKHIDEDKDKSTYRIGNTIHTKLSKSLTSVTTMSLQVECYKEDENGNATLIGKTPLVANLVLKPSPNGFPAFNYNGSFEDIENVIEMAHNHNNLDILKKFSTDRNGMLCFNGHPIEEILTYDKPCDLPQDAQNGAFAIVLNDDEGIATEIEADTSYEYITVKRTADITDFSSLKDFCNDDDDGEEYINRDYIIKTFHDDCEIGVSFAYRKNDGTSYFLIGMRETENYKVLLNPEKYTAGEGAYFYLYNPGKPYPISELTGNESEYIVPSGWCKIIEYKDNFTASGTTYINLNYDYVDVVEPIEDSDALFLPNFSARLESYHDSKNKQLEKEFLNAFFEVPTEQNKRGLYIRNGETWVNLSDSINQKTIVVNRFEQLPNDVGNGSIAFVLEDENIFETDASCVLYLTTFAKNMYFNPLPGKRGRVLNFTLEVGYGSKSSNTLNKVGTAFTLETNIEEGYFYLNILNRTTNDYDEYIYSYDSGNIKISDELTVSVEKGWNLIGLDDDDNVTFEHIEPINAPSISFSNTSYYMAITNLTIENYPSATSIPTDIFQMSTYIDKLSLAGTWLKTDGDWVLINTKEEN
jgi:hypothetical protein